MLFTILASDARHIPKEFLTGAFLPFSRLTHLEFKMRQSVAGHFTKIDICREVFALLGSDAVNLPIYRLPRGKVPFASDGVEIAFFASDTNFFAISPIHFYTMSDNKSPLCHVSEFNIQCTSWHMPLLRYVRCQYKVNQTVQCQAEMFHIIPWQCL